jgi:hypothetical protein
VSRLALAVCVVATAGGVAFLGALSVVVEADTPASAAAAPVAQLAWVELGEVRETEGAPGPTSRWVDGARRIGAEIQVVRADVLERLDLYRYVALVLRDREELSSSDLRSLTELLGRGTAVVLRGRARAGDGSPGTRPRSILSRLVAGGREPAGFRAGGPPRLHRARYGRGPVVWVPHEPSERQVENALRWVLRQPSVEVEGAPPHASGLEVRLQSLGPGRLEVELRNVGDLPARPAGARVYLPVGAGRPSARPAGWLVPTAVVHVAPDLSWVSLSVRELDAGDSARYAVRYGPPLDVGTTSASGSVAGSEQARPRQM